MNDDDDDSNEWLSNNKAVCQFCVIRHNNGLT